jgi:sugar phosphate isomerase/epimerase
MARDAGNLTRRDFLVRSGLAVGALGAGGALGCRPADATPDDAAPALAAAGAGGEAALEPIGVQLYTVRSEMQRSVEETLGRVAAIGYREVEFAGYFGRTPRQVRTLLDVNGLAAPSSHGGDVNTIRTRWPQAIEDAAVVGHRYLVCASLPRSDHNADGFKRSAELLNRAGEESAKSGITMVYHNHDFEFQPLGDTIGYDILLAECDAALVKMQLDLFWIVKGGRDAVDYFTRHAGRFVSVHVKDMDAEGRMVDVGAGQLPFATILAQAPRAGVRHYFVEHDQPADPMASIRVSFEHLRALRVG